MTYYQLLGIPPTASPDQIRGAYRNAVRRYHPDVNRAPNASQITAQLNEAWAVLGDPRSRAAYDRSLSQPRPAAQPPAWHRPPPSYGDSAGPGPGAGGYWGQQAQTGYAGQRQSAGYAYYGHAPYETTVAEPPHYGRPISNMGFGTIRIIVAVAFIASVVHWFPLILTIGAGIVIARIFSRSFR